MEKKKNLENIINEKEKINNELKFINEITRNEAFAFLKERDEIKNQLLNTQDELVKNEIEVLFDKMIEGLDGKLDSNTEEKFFRNLQEFVKYLEDYTINEKKFIKNVFEY